MDSALLNIISPELILALGALALLMLGVFSPEGEKTGRFIGWLTIGVLGAAIVALFQQTGVSQAFEGAFVSDPLTRFFKIMILVAAIVAL
ncbi:MAG: NADH-quinone oxidoreductase subunit N, partial [Hyphomicrobium denitrificans]|nr:NADH-quinone oxidoreductase subunit N [Hyphomicrobium denitrificans]